MSDTPANNTIPADLNKKAVSYVGLWKDYDVAEAAFFERFPLASRDALLTIENKVVDGMSLEEVKKSKEYTDGMADPVREQLDKLLATAQTYGESKRELLWDLRALPGGVEANAPKAEAVVDALMNSEEFEKKDWKNFDAQAIVNRYLPDQLKQFSAAPAQPTPEIHPDIAALKGDEEVIHLSDKEIKATDIPDLAKKFSEKLDALDLSHNEIGDVGATTLASKLPKSLTKLDLSLTTIGFVGATALAGKFPAGLKVLDLNFNEMGSKGAKALAGQLPAGLEVLNLSYSEMGNEGVAAFTGQLPASLKELNLHLNGITEISQDWLDKLPASLKKLDVSGNTLTPESLVRVAFVAETSGIELVGLTSEEIAAARATVKAATPTPTPAEPAFTFNETLQKDDVVKAIYNIDHNAWKKKEEAAKGSGGAEPQLGSYTATYKETNEQDGQKVLALYAPQLAADKPIAEHAEQGKKLANVLLQIEKDSNGANRPDVHVKGGRDFADHTLEPKELGAYLTTGLKTVDGKTTLQPVDEWVTENKIGLTESASFQTKMNGEEKLAFETLPGERRVVSAGGDFIITKPSQGYYGEVTGVTTGDHDALDIYVSPDIHDNITETSPYKGDVYVMQQMKNGKPDELKVGYAKDENEFRDMQTSTWSDKEKFKGIEGTYVKLTHEQYEELKAEIRDNKNPNLTLDEFIDQQMQERGVDLKTQIVVPAALKPAAPGPANPDVTAMENAQKAADKLIYLGYLPADHELTPADIAETRLPSTVTVEKGKESELYKATEQFKLNHWTDAKLGKTYIDQLVKGLGDETGNETIDKARDQLTSLSNELGKIKERPQQFKELKDLTDEQKAAVQTAINAHLTPGQKTTILADINANRTIVKGQAKIDDLNSPVVIGSGVIEDVVIADKKLNYTDGKITGSVLGAMDKEIAARKAKVMPTITPDEQTKATQEVFGAIDKHASDKAAFEKSLGEIQAKYPGMSLDAHAKHAAGYNFTPLEYAAFNNEPVAVASLLAKGANVNAQGVVGWTPLHSAAVMNAKESAQLLLAKDGIDLTKTGEYTNRAGKVGQATALEIAKDLGYTELAALIEAKAAQLAAQKAAPAQAPAAPGVPAGTPPAGGGGTPAVPVVPPVVPVVPPAAPGVPAPAVPPTAPAPAAPPVVPPAPPAAPAAPATPPAGAAPATPPATTYPLYPTDRLEGIIKRRDMIDLGKGGKGEDVNGKLVDKETATQIQAGLLASGVAKIIPQADYDELKKAAKGKIVADTNGVILFGDKEEGIYGKQTDAAIAKLQKVTGFLKEDHVAGRAAAVVLIEALNGTKLVDKDGKSIPEGIEKVKKAVHDELLNGPAGEKPGFDDKEKNAIKDRNVDLLTPPATPAGAKPAPGAASKGP